MKNKLTKKLALTIFTAIIYGTSYAATLQPTSQPSVKSALAPNPKDKTSCENLKGKWGKIGIYPQEVCNLPTKDANTVCNDSSECEGACLAELSKEQIESVWRGGKIISTSGKCTAWRMVVGCKPFVTDGKVKGLRCQD